MLSSLQTEYLPFKSIIYSVLLHFGVLGLFTFVFPVSPQPHKPVFVFFGQILKGNELSVFSPDISPTAAPILDVHLQVNKIYEIKPYDDRSVPKPSYTAISKDQDKQTPKVIEIPESRGRGSIQLDDVNLPKIPATPKYQPLRFHTK